MDTVQKMEVDDSSSYKIENQLTETKNPNNQISNGYKAITLDQRIDIIREFDQEKSIKCISKKFGCSMKEITFILNNRMEYIEEWNVKHPVNSGNRVFTKRLRSPHIICLNILLFEYVWRLRHYPIEVTDDNLKCIARTFSNKIKCYPYKPKRFLERFKSFYRLDGSQLMTSNIMNDGKKKKSVLLDDIFKNIENELKKKNTIITNLKRDDLYTLDYMRIKKLNESLEIDERPKIRLKQPRLRKMYVEKSVMTDTFDLKQEMKKEEINTYEKALNRMQEVLDFVLINEDLRGISLMNHLEIHFKDKINQNKK